MKAGCSYFGNRIPRHVATDMKRLAREGFNLICHTYSENDMLFYHSTMKEIVRISKEEGMEVYAGPWGVGKVFGGEAFSNFVCCNLDCTQTLSDGKPAGMACPMNPRFRTFMTEWIESALGIGAETLFWDEPHFSISTWLGGRKGQWGCRCDICQGHFRERYGHEMPFEKTDEIVDYLEWGIRDFITFLVAETKKRGGRNALCLLPHGKGVEGEVKAWDAFAAIPGMDVFCTDPYFELQKLTIDHVDDFSRLVVDCARPRGLETQIWVQGFRVAAGREHLQVEAIQRAYDAGVRNIAIWGVDACDHMAWIRPDNPQLLWEMLVAKLQELKRREG
ncbi:MAG: hypothetical protein KF858_01635 [Candidatus Sumerlaeia bacterium]|nr:hypothetical protein [Candidatus Sumerlaeia bacterium]